MPLAAAVHLELLLGVGHEGLLDVADHLSGDEQGGQQLGQWVFTLQSAVLVGIDIDYPVFTESAPRPI